MTKSLSYIGLSLAVLLWGISFISVAIILEHLSVSELNIVRLLLSTAMLWLVELLRPKKMAFKAKDLPIIFLSGLLGTAGYYYFTNIGSILLSPDVISLVSGGIPVITLVVAIILFRKKTNFKNIFLVLVSFCGMAVLMNPWAEHTITNGRGIGVVLVGNLFWSLYTLLNEPLDRKYDVLQLLTLQYTAGLVVFSGYYFYELIRNPKIEMLTFAKVAAHSNVLGHLIFVALFVSIGTYYLYNYALVHLGVMISALFINVVPVMTLLVSIALGFQVLTFHQVAGTLLVVIAIFFIDDL